MVSASVVVAFGFYQYVANLAGLPEWVTGLRDRYSWQQFGFPRIQSTALEPLYLISYLLIPLAFGITFFLVGRPKNTRTSKKLIILLFGMIATVFLSVSRGGILAFAVLVVYLGICVAGLKLTSLRRIGGLFSIVAGGFLIAIVLINYLNKPPQNPLLTHGKKGTSAYTQQLQTTGLEGGGDERAQTRNEAITILKSSNRTVVVGLGPGQFGPRVQNNQKGGGWFIVNNLTLELLVEYGFIGALLFAGFVISLFVAAFKSLRSSKNANQKLAAIALSGYLIATAIQYQTFSTLYIMHIWVTIGLFMALTKSHGTSKRHQA